MALMRKQRDLISIWGEEAVQSALQKTHKNMDVFESVASQMRGMGHNRENPYLSTGELDRIFANDKSVNNEDPYRATDCVYVSCRAPSAAETSHASVGATQRMDVGATQSSRQPLMTINEMDIRPPSPSLLQSGVSINMSHRALARDAQGECGLQELTWPPKKEI
uniref:Uncharacterized protein n=1 Tax=Sphaerodactylus townsendi TaxID=933632 RepID=A0ACB8EI90_9SAUR